MSDTKNRIMDIALSLFSKYSFEATGIQAIVDGADVSKPTLYYHFENKAGLLRSVLQRNLTPFIQKLQEVCKYNGNLQDSMETAAKEYIRFAKENPELFRLFSSISAMAPESESHKIVQPFLWTETDVFVDLFKDARDDHGNIHSRYEVYGHTARATLHNLCHMKLGKFEYPDQEGLQFRVVHQFLHGVYS